MDAQLRALEFLTEYLFSLYDLGYSEDHPTVQRIWAATDALNEQVRPHYTCGCC